MDSQLPTKMQEIIETLVTDGRGYNGTDNLRDIPSHLRESMVGVYLTLLNMDTADKRFTLGMRESYFSAATLKLDRPCNVFSWQDFLDFCEGGFLNQKIRRVPRERSNFNFSEILEEELYPSKFRSPKILKDEFYWRYQALGFKGKDKRGVF